MRRSDLFFARRRHPNRLGRQVRNDFLAHYAHGRFGDTGCASRRMDGVVGHGQFDCALIRTAADHLQQNDISVGLNVELAALLRLSLFIWSFIILTGSCASCAVTQLVDVFAGARSPFTTLVSVSSQRPGWISLAAYAGNAQSKTNSPATRYLVRMKPPNRNYNFRGPHIRNTPNRVPRTGALSAAENAKASTRRVSEGAMMPSSHSRAVA